VPEGGGRKVKGLFASMSMPSHPLSSIYTPTVLEHSIFMYAFMTMGDCLNESARKPYFL
jgi:hypothetical protein